jgi:hypothetical protein
VIVRENLSQREKERVRSMGEDSLLERVTAAAEERHLSENTLTAYGEHFKTGAGK